MEPRRDFPKVDQLTKDTLRNVIHIFIKETGSFFNSLVGYLALGAFLGLSGLFFWVFNNSVLFSGLANMDMLFGSAPYLFLFLIPAITQSTFSDEFKSKVPKYDFWKRSGPRFVQLRNSVLQEARLSEIILFPLDYN